MSIVLKIFLFLIIFGISSSSIASDNTNATSGNPVVDHGDAQVSLVVQDRPLLQDIVYRNNPIWKWLQNAFNYSVDKEKIYRDPGPTLKANTFGGETQFLETTRMCFVRIDRTYKEGRWSGVDKKAEEVLASLVFELNNAQHQDEFLKIRQMAIEGKLSRNEFILASAKVEFKSEMGVKKFLVNTWLPFCESRHIQSDLQIWWMCQPVTFDDLMKFYPPGSAYPWKIYGDQYDGLVRRDDHN